MHFGFKCEKKIADWLSSKPNRSETIRSALRKQMILELRQFGTNESEKSNKKPIEGTHLITLVRMPKRSGFKRGKKWATCSLKRAYARQRKRMRVRGENDENSAGDSCMDLGCIRNLHGN